MQLYSETDVDISALADKQVTVLGYGSQGRAHALNLKDSGHDVVVGVREGGAGWQQAQRDGLEVAEPAAARGPGFTTSAPEIAEQLTLRPAQIQRSLEKLSHNKMLEYTIGSTDGFDNYRVSQMGSAFALNWSRQRAGV